MAAPIATQPPTLQRAWEAYLRHVPAMTVVLLTSAAISLLGAVVQLGLLTVLGGLATNTGQGLGAVVVFLAQMAQIPFAVLSALVGVLLTVVPALHYETGQSVGVSAAFAALLQRPRRYLLAGLLFALAAVVGLSLCVLPVFVVWLVMPVYANRVFLTDRPVADALATSFRAVLGTPQGRSFLLLQIPVWAAVAAVSLLTCGVGSLLAVPIACFFVQNAAYAYGVVR